MKKLSVLVACEYSGIVRDAFLRRGHDAMSCDILPTESPGPHYEGDVLDVLDDSWDLMIAHPPCTYLSNAGACRLYPTKGQIDENRYWKGMEARQFFMKLYFANIPKIAIENPVPSKVFNLPVHTQEIQPYQFGHPYTKKTRLWLKNLPTLTPTEIVQPLGPYVPSGTGRKDKSKYGYAKRGDDSKNRSRFWPNIATAMVEQLTL